MESTVFTIHLIHMKDDVLSTKEVKEGKEEEEENDDDDDDDDRREATVESVQQKILTYYPLLLSCMKRGDAVEDLDAGGYRSAGIYFVDHVDVCNSSSSSSSSSNNNNNNTNPTILQLIPRSFVLSEYGSQPLHYTTLDQFKPNYFNPKLAQINDLYYPGEKSELYWHNDVGWDILSLDLSQRIVRNVDDENQGTLEYEGNVYTMMNLQEAELNNGQLFFGGYNAETKTFYGGY